jgi:hypothetical protein
MYRKSSIVSYDSQVPRGVVEVPEAREEIEDAVEGVGDERRPHVVPAEPEVRTFVLAGPRNTCGGQIEARHVEAPSREVSGVSTRGAGEIQDRCAVGRLQSRNQPVEERAGFTRAPVRVQLLEVRGVKPRGKPFGC